MYITSQLCYFSQINTRQTSFEASQRTARGIYTENALLFRWTLMILHLLRMRRNVNRNVSNDRKNSSATPHPNTYDIRYCGGETFLENLFYLDQRLLCMWYLPVITASRYSY